MFAIYSRSTKPPPSTSIRGRDYTKKELVIQLTHALHQCCSASRPSLRYISLPALHIPPLLVYSSPHQLVPGIPPPFLTRSTLSATCLSKEGVVKAQGDRRSDSSPSSSDNLLILQSDTHVPGQMPQAVQAVEEERESEESLQSHLHSRRPRSNCCHH